MKSIFFVVLFAFTVGPFSSSANGRGRRERMTSDECSEVRRACQDAGFKKRPHGENGRKLFKDCLEKLIAGRPVAGVKLQPADPAVAKCQSAVVKSRGKSAH